MTLYVRVMDVPARIAQGVTDDAKVRLRRDVYEALAAKRGAESVAEQVALIGLPRKTLYRIRRGDNPSMASAVKIAAALGSSVDALFERIEDAA
jgi:DNA-binding XRE family transcriptional regulator